MEAWLFNVSNTGLRDPDKIISVFKNPYILVLNPIWVQPREQRGKQKLDHSSEASLI